MWSQSLELNTSIAISSMKIDDGAYAFTVLLDGNEIMRSISEYQTRNAAFIAGKAYLGLMGYGIKEDKNEI